MKKFKLYINIILGVIITAVIAINIIKLNAKSEKIDKEYPTLKKSDSVCGKITYILDVKALGFRESGLDKLLIVDNKKMTVVCELIGNKQAAFGFMVSIGDSIVKNQNTDSLYLIKETGEKYLFLRHDDIFFDKEE